VAAALVVAPLSCSALPVATIHSTIVVITAWSVMLGARLWARVFVLQERAATPLSSDHCDRPGTPSPYRIGARGARGGARCLQGTSRGFASLPPRASPCSGVDSNLPPCWW
jgi:hypothetical protein